MPLFIIRPDNMLDETATTLETAKRLADAIAARYSVGVFVYSPDGRLVYQCGVWLA